MKVLEVKNISKSFDGVKIIKGINFSVESNEIVSIIGKSGAGKSTLLRLLTNIIKVDNGSIAYENEYLVKDGKYIDKKNERRISQKFGLVFQQFNLFPHMTVQDNIKVPLKINFSKTEEEATDIAFNILKDLDLEEKMNAYPSELSGGQKQRVAIARAIALKPRVLFFDEPTASLDPELTRYMVVLFKKLSENQITPIIVTHDVPFAMEVSTRMIFIDDGVIEVDTDINNIKTEMKNNEKLNSFLSEEN